MLKRLDAYLATLPKGLDSFPDCQVKASLQRTAMEYLSPSPELLQALPPALAASVKAAPAQSDPWFPQVHSVALSLAVADHRNLDTRAWTAFVREGNRKIFGGFAMRVLLAVASPSQLVLAGRVKWNTLRRGTRLEAETSGPRSAAVKLHMPPRVFPVDYLPVIEGGVPGHARAVPRRATAHHPRPGHGHARQLRGRVVTGAARVWLRHHAFTARRAPGAASGPAPGG